MTDTQRVVMQQAIDALTNSQDYIEASADEKVHHEWGNQWDDEDAAILALRAALAEPVVKDCLTTEPEKEVLQFLTDVVTAAGLLEHGKQSKALAERISNGAFSLRPLFAAPRPAVEVPLLTNKEIADIDDEVMKAPRNYCVKFARAIEARVRQNAGLKS